MLSLDGNEFIGYKSLELLILLLMFYLYCKKDLYAGEMCIFSAGKTYNILEYNYKEYKFSKIRDAQNAFLVLNNMKEKMWVTDSQFYGHMSAFSLEMDIVTKDNIHITIAYVTPDGKMFYSEKLALAYIQSISNEKEND